MHPEAVLLYQVHYIGRVENEQYRAEYTALWHAELDGRRCWVLDAMWHMLLALAQVRRKPREGWAVQPKWPPQAEK